MDRKRHAFLARRLIRACGGLEEASNCCRLKKTQLSNFCDPTSGQFMPADVMADLQEYCGEPIYAQGMVDDRPSATMAKALLDEALETTEASAALQGVVRRAVGDGKIDALERKRIEAGIADLEQQLRELSAAAREGLSS